MSWVSNSPSTQRSPAQRSQASFWYVRFLPFSYIAKLNRSNQSFLFKQIEKIFRGIQVAPLTKKWILPRDNALAKVNSSHQG